MTGLLTADQVAQMLSVPTSWIYAEARAGRLPVVELGRYRRFRAEALEEWIKEREKRNGKATASRDTVSATQRERKA